MRIDDDHMYHGAALVQIAEHPQFTAINSARVKGIVVENTFQVNQTMAIHLKYASKPNKAYDEFVFTFQKHHLKTLRLLSNQVSVFIGLVCVRARQICCLNLDELELLIEARNEAKGGEEEDQYTLLVVMPGGKQFRVYMNAPGQKKTKLKELLVPRNAFPDSLFQKT